eukprot:scaffold190269_cov16-Tisochrysis_lutea.AAC.1
MDLTASRRVQPQPGSVGQCLPQDLERGSIWVTNQTLDHGSPCVLHVIHHVGCAHLWSTGRFVIRPSERKKKLRKQENLPASIKEKETRWLKRAVSSLHKATKQIMLIIRVIQRMLKMWY